MTYYEYLKDKKKRDRILREEFGISEKEFPKTVVVSPLTFDRVFVADLNFFKEHLEVEVREQKDKMLARLQPNWVLKGKEKIAVLFTGRGPTEFIDHLVILLHSPRIENIIFIGTRASLSEEIKEGDINIPNLAIPLEGISKEYVIPPEAIPVANEESKAKVEKMLRNLGIKVHSELHATVPLLFIESTRFLKFLRDIGIKTIDMEVSALYRMCDFFKKKTVAILEVSDLPLQKRDVYKKKEEEIIRRYIKTHIALSRFLVELANRSLDLNCS